MLNPSTNDQPIEMKLDALRLYPGAAMQLQSMSAEVLPASEFQEDIHYDQLKLGM